MPNTVAISAAGHRLDLAQHQHLAKQRRHRVQRAGQHGTIPGLDQTGLSRGFVRPRWRAVRGRHRHLGHTPDLIGITLLVAHGGAVPAPSRPRCARSRQQPGANGVTAEPRRIHARREYMQPGPHPRRRHGSASARKRAKKTRPDAVRQAARSASVRATGPRRWYGSSWAKIRGGGDLFPGLVGFLILSFDWRLDDGPETPAPPTPAASRSRHRPAAFVGGWAGKDLGKAQRSPFSCADER